MQVYYTLAPQNFLLDLPMFVCTFPTVKHENKLQRLKSGRIHGIRNTACGNTNTLYIMTDVITFPRPWIHWYLISSKRLKSSWYSIYICILGVVVSCTKKPIVLEISPYIPFLCETTTANNAFRNNFVCILYIVK